MKMLTEADHQAMDTLLAWAGQKRNRHIALDYVWPTGGGDVGWWVEIAWAGQKLYLDELEAMTEEEREDYTFPGLARVIHTLIRQAEEKGW